MIVLNAQENQHEQFSHDQHLLLAMDDFAYLVEGYQELLPVGGGIESHLGDTLMDTLAHPGSLVRAQLAYGILQNHGVNKKRSLHLAIALEYFHSASLIFDDLPAMDHATIRRGGPCPHVEYGEAAAILGALALVNQGYALLWNVIGSLPARQNQAAAELITSCLGIGGILNGQAMDLHFQNSTQSMEDVIQVAKGKTVTLLRLSIMLPAIVAGEDDNETLELLESLSTSWGLSYQIMDDFKDCLMSTFETGKSPCMDWKRDRPNLPIKMGYLGAMETLGSLFKDAETTVIALGKRKKAWTVLDRMHAKLSAEQHRISESVEARLCI